MKLSCPACGQVVLAKPDATVVKCPNCGFKATPPPPQGYAPTPGFAVMPPPGGSPTWGYAPAPTPPPSAPAQVPLPPSAPYPGYAATPPPMPYGGGPPASPYAPTPPYARPNRKRGWIIGISIAVGAIILLAIIGYFVQEKDDEDKVEAFNTYGDKSHELFQANPDCEEGFDVVGELYDYEASGRNYPDDPTPALDAMVDACTTVRSGMEALSRPGFAEALHDARVAFVDGMVDIARDWRRAYENPGSAESRTATRDAMEGVGGLCALMEEVVAGFNEVEDWMADHDADLDQEFRDTKADAEAARDFLCTL